MSTENKKSFEWVLYIIGILTGVLVVFAVTTHFGYMLLGGIVGLIFTAIFLGNVVKKRQY